VCTLVALYKKVENYPLIIGANRDEDYTRESLPPDILQTVPVICGGKDKEAGGTWMGVNQYGVFAGLTNRYSYRPHDKTKKSRGLLCLEILSQGSASEIASFMNELDPELYNDFNLLYADRDNAYVSYCYGTIKTDRLQQGIHVITNHGDADDRSIPVSERAIPLINSFRFDNSDITISQIQKLCKEHLDVSDTRHSICVHGEKFGTVSSSIVALN